MQWVSQSKSMSIFISSFSTEKALNTFHFKWISLCGLLLTLWRQHALTCDIILQLFPWPPRGQPAFTTQCDCQHSFHGLTRGAPHNQRRRQWTMSLGTAGWASMADPVLSTSAPGCCCCCCCCCCCAVTSVNTRSTTCSQLQASFALQQRCGQLCHCTFTSQATKCGVKYVMWRGLHYADEGDGGETWVWHCIVRCTQNFLKCSLKISIQISIVAFWFYSCVSQVVAWADTHVGSQGVCFKGGSPFSKV